MIPLAHVMPERSVSELLETSQFLLDCDMNMNTSELLLEQLSGDSDGMTTTQHHPEQDDDAILQRLFNSHDRQREQELLIEQPIFEDYIRFPPPPLLAYSSPGPARRTRSQTSTTGSTTPQSYGRDPPPDTEGAVTAHDSNGSASSPAVATATTNNTTTSTTTISDGYTDFDVIMGRGGKTNNHKGNHLYLRDKEELQPRYFSASKSEKTTVAQELVDRVHARGGRFMKEQHDDADRPNGGGAGPGTGWVEVTNDLARRKASQSLREVSSKELRAKKREKYNQKRAPPAAAAAASPRPTKQPSPSHQPQP
jgi:hypothetical protein